MSNLIHINQTDLSDFFKEANGFRPRDIYKDWWTQEELDAEYKRLNQICEENRIIETKREEESLQRFNILIYRTIKNGAGNRKTAIRWLLQAEKLDFNLHDLQYFFWKYGLSYEIQNKWAKDLTNNN